jgi:hypothetical protein
MSEDPFAVKRSCPRVTFAASTEIVESRGGTSWNMRISELSARGCYVDTLNPFDIGTQIDLRISHQGRTCRTRGKVLYSHAGFGMGVFFVDLAAEQQAVLQDWLASSGAQAN